MYISGNIMLYFLYVYNLNQWKYIVLWLNFAVQWAEWNFKRLRFSIQKKQLDQSISK